jgi:hypothetical protein
VHATGSRADRRQSRQEAKGRKESRDRRVDCDPQDERRRERSWEVKKAREVLRFECDIFLAVNYVLMEIREQPSRA